MAIEQISFVIVALLPTLFTVIFLLLEKKTKFGKMKYMHRQIIIGVIFGALAVLGTECGIPIEGAQVNCRDAAVLTAGLVFGGPAGIIAGCIGGIERALAILWGVGQYTWIACAISTCVAGFFGAALRKYMFDERKPGFLLSLAIGVVIEVFHMLMILFTHIPDATNALTVIEACTLIMVIGNAVSLFIAVFVATLISENRLFEERSKTKITYTIQRWLLVTVAIAFLISSYFVFSIQTNLSNVQEQKLLTVALDDAEQEINDAYENKLIRYMDVSESTAAFYYNKEYYTDVDKKILDITRNSHIGQTGFTLVFDKNFNILSAPEDVSEELATSAVKIIQTPKENETFKADIDDVTYICKYRSVKEYYVLSMISLDEVYSSRNTSTYINSFMEILIFAIMFALIYMLIKRVIVNKLNKINSSLGKITKGDLKEVVDVRSNAEFVSLSDDINLTVDALKNLINEAEKRIDEELQMAREIQKSALPDAEKALSKKVGFDIHATMNPAKEVGGDFYDFYMTGDETLNFIIADVSGKGIPGAMFMMRSKTELRTLTESGLSIDETFTQGNNALCEGNDSGMFVTAWQAQVDLTNGNIDFANAGHNPPLIKRKDGKFEYLKEKAGFVLAGIDGFKYKLQKIKLEPGDIIFIYTDGVTEANNKNEELFGEERLLNAVNSIEFESMEEFCAKVKEEVDAFVGDADQFDDMTMVAFRFDGIKPVPQIDIEEAGLEDLDSITAFIEKELDELACPMKEKMQLLVATDEIYSNIIKHGYKKSKGPVTVKVIPSEDQRAVYLRFEDEAEPYNPIAKTSPDITLSAEEREIGGLGIFIVIKTMDDVRYKYEHNRNIITLKKFIKD